MKKRGIALLLLIMTVCTSFAGCRQTAEPAGPGTGEETQAETLPGEGGEEETVVNRIADYVTKYADDAAYTAWLEEHLLKTEIPPVSFTVDGASSDTLAWKRSEEKAVPVTDYPDEAPFTRLTQLIHYDCADKDLRVDLTLTRYPGYPVVEYDAVLINTASGNSARLSSLQSIDDVIDPKDGVRFLHATRGSTYGTTLVAGTDFAPLTYSSFDGSGVTVEVKTGRPTETFIPYFNLENPEYNTGTIAILNWQGSWKANFRKDGDGIRLQAGQNETDFVLQKEETARFPGVVLLFYKGDYLNGQNVYRRFAYQCNLFREQGKHMKSTNVLVCSQTTSEKGDLAEIEMYSSAPGLIELIDKFNIDAGDATHGWYLTDGHSWDYVGNWEPNGKYYPDGLKPVSDAAHEAGLSFAVWFEPERLYGGTAVAEDLKDSVLYVNGDGTACLGDDIPVGARCLLNYADPKAVEYVVEMLDAAIKEYGIDQYRQDYNIQPAPYWTAYDGYEAKTLGVPRTGMTENRACTGYLSVWTQLEERNPGMYFDACATGGARYDLSTMRFAFLHTRSDEWADIEHAQNQSYGASMWFLYCGTGFTDLSSYDVRSHIGNSIGVGITSPSQAAKLEGALTEWTELADYLFGDYYVLTPYAGNSKKTMAMQYDSPEDGIGMFITYFRQDGEITLCPHGLDPAAKYVIWDRDAKAETERTLTGAEIMAGYAIGGKARTAVVTEYRLADGENTEAFRKAEVPTGKGSTDFDPTVYGEEGKLKVTVPTVDAGYSPLGMSDAELEKAYKIEGDGEVSFVGYDGTSSGGFYAISRDLFEAAVRAKSGTEVRGWTPLDKGKVEVKVAGGWYTYHQWDGMVFVQQPYVKQIGETYFLWLTNTTGLSDTDGAWQNWQILLRFTDGKGNVLTTEPFTIWCEGKKAQRIGFEAPAESSPSDSVFRIDEAIFGSLPYTGYGVEREGKTWYEVDMTRCGRVLTAGSKAPDEKRGLETQMQLFEEGENVRFYTTLADGVPYLYFENAADFTGRMAIAWIDADGACCAQSFLMN